MTTFDVAHLYEQGQNIIMVLVGQPATQQVADALQVCATCAGLAGVVVPVWPQPFGGYGYLAPMQWHGFFQSIDWNFICANVNRTLMCG